MNLNYSFLLIEQHVLTRKQEELRCKTWILPPIKNNPHNRVCVYGVEPWKKHQLTKVSSGYPRTPVFSVHAHVGCDLDTKSPVLQCLLLLELPPYPFPRYPSGLVSFLISEQCIEYFFCDRHCVGHQ